MSLKEKSEQLHRREIMFHAFAIGGKKFIAFPEVSGNIAIMDDQFRNYGGFRSLMQFIQHYRAGDHSPIGIVFSITRRAHDCCGVNPISETCESEEKSGQPCDARQLMRRVDSINARSEDGQQGEDSDGGDESGGAEDT